MGKSSRKVSLMASPDQSLNPYAAPELPADAIQHDPTVQRNWIGVTTVLLVTLTYCGFTLVLLTSGANPDRTAGLIWLANWPVLGFWLLATRLQWSVRYRMFYFAVLVQIGIAIAIIKVLPMAEPVAVVGLDGVAALAFAAAHAVLSWQRMSNRKSGGETISDPTPEQ